jgi:hypothetical protein
MSGEAAWLAEAIVEFLKVRGTAWERGQDRPATQDRRGLSGFTKRVLCVARLRLSGPALHQPTYELHRRALPGVHAGRGEQVRARQRSHCSRCSLHRRAAQLHCCKAPSPPPRGLCERYDGVPTSTCRLEYTIVRPGLGAQLTQPSASAPRHQAT